MTNTLREGDRDLVRLDYTGLLSAILEALQNPEANNPFRISANKKHLHIEIDKIAYNLATNLHNSIETPLIGNWRSARVATTNFTESSQDVFAEKNRAIRDCLEQYLESLLQDNKYDSIDKFLKKFWTELTEFQGKVSNKISLEYDFKQKYSGLSKQRLTLQQEEGANPKQRAEFTLF